MKTFRVLGFLLVCILLLQFRPIEIDPSDACAEYLLQEKTALLGHLEQLEKEGSLSSPNWEKARHHLHLARLSYKRIEFLLAWYDKGSASLINAAPIAKVDVSNAQYITLAPTGIQVLEELLYEEDPDIHPILSELQKTNRLVNAIDKRVPLKGAMNREGVYLSVHFGLIRILTQGITGFDSPASGKAMEESAVALESMAVVLEQFQEEFDSGKWARFRFSIHKASDFLLENPEFDRFDRFGFIRDHGNSLLNALVSLRESWAELDLTRYRNGRNPVNPDSRNLFDPYFLDPLAYSSDPSDTLSPARLELGRYLFFDPILSAGNKRSCASCHRPGLAFSDGRNKSLAFDGLNDVGRNSPGLLNSAYQSAQFWDLRETFLEDQIDHVVSNGKEFHSSYTEIMRKLAQSREYDSLFHAAFPDASEPVNIRYFNLALADYLRSLQSFNSPFDRMIRGEQKADEAVVSGFNLFMGKALCATCHFPPTFSGMVPPEYTEMESEVLGVPANTNWDSTSLDPDQGRYHFQQAEAFRRSFKTPGIRNAALTAPYMHHGAFGSLEEVVEFYRRGGGAGLGLKVPNQTLPFDSLELSAQDQMDLISFMKALSDPGNYTAPNRLPLMDVDAWNRRKTGGEY